MSTKEAPKQRTLRAILPVSIPAADGAVIDAAAAKVGEPVSRFIREAALDRARTILGIPAEAPLAAAS